MISPLQTLAISLGLLAQAAVRAEPTREDLCAAAITNADRIVYCSTPGMDTGFTMLPLKPLTPDDEVVNQQIDSALIRWSKAWMFDRYLKGTAVISERAFLDSDYLIRGSFTFDRMGSRFTIPFGALFRPVESDYQFISLCYKDKSSGMQDCVEPINGIAQRQAAMNQTRQALAAIAVLGAAAAITSGSVDRHGGETRSAPRKRMCHTEYSYATPGMTGYEDNGVMGSGIPYQHCD